MELYKAVIKNGAPYASPLQSDTIFGAFCWSYRYMYGENALEELLADGLNGNVRLVFSNAFPSGYLPLPMGIHDEQRDRTVEKSKEDKHKDYQENKRLKKCNLISLDSFSKVAQGKTFGFSSALSKETAITSEVMHNTVSRLLGTVSEDIDGGGLYSNIQYFAKDAKYDLYILTSLDKDVLKAVLEQMLQLGIGGKKSIGNGYFTLEEGPELCPEMLECPGANAFVALSNFIPSSDNPTEGAYRTFVKNGKLDREYASDEHPFKKPLLFIESGAVFRTDHIRPYFGRYINKIAVKPEIVVNACTIAVPIIWKGAE